MRWGCLETRSSGNHAACDGVCQHVTRFCVCANAVVVVAIACSRCGYDRSRNKLFVENTLAADDLINFKEVCIDEA